MIEAGIEKYHRLFERFMKLMAARGWDLCFVSMPGEGFRVMFDLALQQNTELVPEIMSWPEWQDLDEWITDNGGSSMNVITVVGRQFTSLCNQFQLVQTQSTSEIKRVLPTLTPETLDTDVFEQTVLGDANQGYVAHEDKFIILIQGLKIRDRIDVGALGFFDTLDDRYVDHQTLQPIRNSYKHLYTGFVTDRPEFHDTKSLIALMTAIRTHRFQHDGDVKYAGWTGLYRGLTGKIVCYRPGHVVTYTEESALFDTRAPRLIELGRPGGVRLAKHIDRVYPGFLDLEMACDFLCRSEIAPKKIQIPLVFFALETLFEIPKGIKKKILGAYVAEVLGKGKDTADLIIALYELRNAIAHGDQADIQVKTETLRKMPVYTQFTRNFDQVLPTIARAVFRALAVRKWDAASDTPILTKQIKKTRPDLRKLFKR